MYNSIDKGQDNIQHHANEAVYKTHQKTNEKVRII